MNNDLYELYNERRKIVMFEKSKSEFQTWEVWEWPCYFHKLTLRFYWLQQFLEWNFPNFEATLSSKSLKQNMKKLVIENIIHEE